jgi:hypothetical protein
MLLLRGGCMKCKVDTNHDIKTQIDLIRNLLHEKLEVYKIGNEEIQKISEELDKLIVDYLRM